MEKFDVVILGGGPAGITAALYTARADLGVCVVHDGASALCKTPKIQNYYGTGVIDGKTLYETGIKQAEEVGAKILKAQAVFASFDGNDFTLCTTAGDITARKFILASGANHIRSDIDGLEKFEGKGVSYCAVCDAFFCRKKRVGVLGAGLYARHEYETLSAVAAECYLLPNGESPAFDAPLTVNKKITKVTGGERISGVVFEDGQTLELDALFVALGSLGKTAIAKSMGVFTDPGGSIITDENRMTNVPGLYAAGDCTAGIKQISRAVYEGMTAGLAVIAALKQK